MQENYKWEVMEKFCLVGLALLLGFLVATLVYNVEVHERQIALESEYVTTVEDGQEQLRYYDSSHKRGNRTYSISDVVVTNLNSLYNKTGDMEYSACLKGWFNEDKNHLHINGIDKIDSDGYLTINALGIEVPAVQVAYCNARNHVGTVHKHPRPYPEVPSYVDIVSVLNNDERANMEVMVIQREPNEFRFVDRGNWRFGIGYTYDQGKLMQRDYIISGD